MNKQTRGKLIIGVKTLSFPIRSNHIGKKIDLAAL